MFTKKDERLIEEIAKQYIEIFRIVKKRCPKNFTNQQIILMFAKTESMFSNIQMQLARLNKKRKSNSNGNGNGKKLLPKINERNKEFYS